MNETGLVDFVLNLTEPRERRDFLNAHRAEWTVACLEEFKARSDSLALSAPRRALEIAEVALEVASVSCIPLAEAIARWARGNASVYLGVYEQALQDYQRSQAIYQAQASGASPGVPSFDVSLAVARLQSNEVSVLKNLGRYEDALRLADTARSLLGPWKTSPYMAALEMNVGSIYRLQGRYEAALAAYERGRAICRALDDALQAARIDVNRAQVLVSMDHFTEAEVLLRSAGQVFVTQGKALPAARADLNQAILLSRQGRCREALRLYDRARTAFARLDVRVDVAVTDLYRTYDYVTLNLLPEAEALAADTHRTLLELGMPRYAALAAGNQGVAARKRGHYRNASQTLRAAREALAQQGSTADAARFDVEQALCLLEWGDLDAAIAVAATAVEALAGCGLPVQAARARLVLADGVLASGDAGRAMVEYGSALDALKGIPVLAWQAHAGQGQAAEAKGLLQAAYDWYSEAITCIQLVQESLEMDEFQAGFLEDKLHVYQRAVRVALALQDPDAAYGLAARAKSGVWRDVLAQTPSESDPSAALQALRARWHWVYNRLTRPEPEQEAAPGNGDLSARWDELRAIERQIAEVRRASRPALQRRTGLTLPAVQQRIPQSTLLVDYVCTADEVIAFVLDASHSAVLSPLAPQRAVEEAIQRWAFNIQSTLLLGHSVPALHSEDLLAEAQHALHDLYQLLFEPLLPYLGDHRSLWIVPHGPLWSVPFAALYDGRQYLIERLAVTYVPAVGVLDRDADHMAFAQTRASLMRSPLIAGCSEEGRLVHTVGETQAVVDTLGGGTLLLESEATRDRIRSAAATATLIHLATHGVFRRDAPLFSCLHLGDGWLTAGDLEEWRMPHAELVTLSACETGVSQDWGSDLLGLARGFFRAGARRLVASRWTVDDASTTKLMSSFYRALCAGRDVASALQGAQVETMRNYEHPFHWAGFELMELI